MGPLTKEKRAKLDAFYEKEFDKLGFLSKPVEGVNDVIKALKDKGYTLIVNTNPILPMEAQLVRMKWGKLNSNDFAYITAYDTCHFAKPDPRLYKELADKFNADPKDCLMVGNDVKGDIIAAKKAGFNVFLITNYIFNRDNDDISNIPQGSFEDLLKYIESLN
jgi:HAD superfamily hydrolase (TIGR01662 family)